MTKQDFNRDSRGYGSTRVAYYDKKMNEYWVIYFSGTIFDKK